MRRRTLVVALALVAGVGTTACSEAPKRSATPNGHAQLQGALDRLVAAGAPGAIVLVSEGERTTRLASGYENVKPKRRMRATDRFRVGSVTKSFLATVVLQLVGEKKLALEDSVERWLPGLIPNGRAITVRQLLNHTAGLYDYLVDGDSTVVEPYLNGNLTYVWQPRKLVQTAVAHPPHFAPGAGWRYCNTCYIALGLIVEAATGNSLAVELNRRIFTPLHLSGTSFDTKPRIVGRHAHGYALDGNELVDVSVFSPSVGWAAGAVVSTADDLALFYGTLLGGRLLRPDLLRAMKTTVAAARLGHGIGYGLGIARVSLPCGAAWGHSGGIPGYATWALNSEDGRRRVVVVATRDELPAGAARALERVAETAYCSEHTEEER